MEGSASLKEPELMVLSEDEDENPSLDSDDDDILEEFSMEVPLVLQDLYSIVGMKAQHRKRRQNGRLRRCPTPYLSEDSPWSELDDDPMGVFTRLKDLQTRLPSTPPPLRALKLTHRQTAEQIRSELREVKQIASQLSLMKDEPLKDNLASHDLAIQRQHKQQSQQENAKYAGFNHQSSRKKLPPATSVVTHVEDRRNLPCTLHCPGSSGMLPNLTCLVCQCLFHAHCQGVPSTGSIGQKAFKCRACSAPTTSPTNPIRPAAAREINSIIKVKLPMAAPNGRRPIVELVMHQNGRYQPIKFSNNMQVTEMISKTLFERATTLQRTLYQKATRVPRVGGRPIFLAINPTTPSNRGQLNTLLCSAQLIRSAPATTGSPSRSPASSSSQSSSKDQQQVAILVRSQSSAKPVLLNVPRKIAIKVKVGTTLSFSASSDQKYTVIDNKIHPPLNSSSSNRTPTSIPPAPRTSTTSPKRRAPDLTVYKGITISRVTDKRSPSPASTPAHTVRRTAPLPTPEVSLYKVASDLDMSPCTPYCPGVTGFPEVECKGCQSLFHAQCVGLLHKRSMSNFLCKMCSRHSAASSSKSASPQVIDLD